MRQANERQHYIVTSSLIDWVHTQNDPWSSTTHNCSYSLGKQHTLSSLIIMTLATGQNGQNFAISL